MREATHKNFRFQKFVCLLAISLFIIKFIAWYLTRSVAILTDALESLVNIISGFVTLYSLHLSRLPRDKNHPYGHGKVEFISAALEGLLISIAAVAIIVESFFRIYSPREGVVKLDYGILLLFFTAIINYIAGYLACKKGEKNRSISLVACGKHLQIDAYSTVGIVLGLIFLSFTGWPWLDIFTALIFSFVILYTGIKLIRRALAGIMDEYDEPLIRELVEYLNLHKKPQWIDLHNLRIIKYGSDLHLDCHLRLPWYFNLNEAHQEIRDFEELVKKKIEWQIELFVHLDPCIEKFCQACSNDKCPVRKQKFIQSNIWILKNVCDTQ